MFALSRKGILGVLALILSASSVKAAEPAPQPAAADVNSQLQSIRSLLQQVKEQEKMLATEQETLEQLQQRQAAFGAAQRDAGQHSQLLDLRDLSAGFTPGRGFFLASDDGNFLLHPWLQFQFRNTTTYRQDVAKETEDTQNGFEVRRLKFGADGNLFSPNLTYMFQFGVDRHTGTVGLEMAWVKLRFDGTPFGLRAGQFKGPLDHEQLAASRFFPAIDRTFVNDTFVNGEGFIKGVSAIYDPGTFIRGEAAFTGGLKNFNTNFQQFPTNTADWGAAARAEFKAFGDWKDYERISAYGIEQRTLAFGAGADCTEGGRGGALVHVADVQYQSTTGWSLYAAYLGRYNRGLTPRNSKSKLTVDTYDPTARFQAAWAANAHWEPYARYEYVHFDGREFPAGARTNVQIITAGLNYYLYGQAAKLSFDVNYLPNGSPVADDGFGLLPDNGRNQLVARAQLQVVF
jgi:hypothetical protein